MEQGSQKGQAVKMPSRREGSYQTTDGFRREKTEGLRTMIRLNVQAVDTGKTLGWKEAQELGVPLSEDPISPPCAHLR